MRLIDADALRERFDNEIPVRPISLTYNKGDVIRAISDAPTVGGWISVKDRLPEDGVTVLVAVNVDFHLGFITRIVETAMVVDGAFCGGGYDRFIGGPCDTEITHWAEMPDLPEVGK